MLITRRNYDSLFNELVSESYDALSSYLTDRTRMDHILKNEMIIDIMKREQKFFIGKCQTALVSLTLYQLGVKWLGKSQDESIIYSQSEEIKKIGTGMFTWETFNIYKYVKGKDIDPWQHERFYIHASNIEGFNIHRVIPNKSTVIASVLFYDGYNIYQSKQMKFSRWRGQWYMSSDKDSYYSNIESNINVLYNIQNY